MLSNKVIIMSKTVSIIIPCFNSEKYLQETIDSLLNQTYSDCEYIFVNDGSTDNTRSILEIIKSNDSRVRIINTENHGISAARNEGLKQVSGKYVLFCDSDDILETNAVEILVEVADKGNYDIVIAQYSILGQPQNTKANSFQPIVADKTELFKLLAECKVFENFIWGKLYKKELFDNYSFDQSLRIWEDIREMLKIVDRCKNGIVIDDCLVRYRQNDASISRVLNSDKINEFCRAQIDKATFLINYYPSIAHLHSESMFQCGALVLSNKLEKKVPLFKDFCIAYKKVVKKAKLKHKLKYFVIKHKSLYRILSFGKRK